METKGAVIKRFMSEMLPKATLTEQTPLMSSGLVDSLGLLNVIEFLQQTFGIKIAAREATVEALDTVERMVALVEKKAAG